MKKLYCLIILGIFLLVLTGCDRESYPVDSVEFQWTTYSTVSRPEIHQNQMTFSDCENNNDCKILEEESCELLKTDDIANPELTVLENKAPTELTALLDSENPTDIPEETLLLLVLDPNKVLSIEIVPDVPHNEAFLLSVITERYVNMDECWDYYEEDSVNLYNRECEIWEKINVYQLSFVPELVNDLLCTVEITDWIVVDKVPRTGKLDDPIEWAELTSIDDQELVLSFEGQVIFDAKGITFSLKTENKEEYQEWLVSYKEHYGDYEMVVKNGKGKEVKRKEK